MLTAYQSRLGNTPQVSIFLHSKKGGFFMEVKLQVNDDVIELHPFVKAVFRSVVFGLTKELRDIPEDIREVQLFIKAD